MNSLLPSYVDENGTTWYPVQHANGAVVCSITPESQKLWQDYADKQRAKLLDRLSQNKLDRF